ncbi:hypothetical protein RI367_007111 [Sorochytrium milnesiophthora]
MSPLLLLAGLVVFAALLSRVDAQALTELELRNYFLNTLHAGFDGYYLQCVAWVAARDMMVNLVFQMLLDYPDLFERVFDDAVVHDQTVLLATQCGVDQTACAVAAATLRDQLKALLPMQPDIYGVVKMYGTLSKIEGGTDYTLRPPAPSPSVHIQ